MGIALRRALEAVFFFQMPQGVGQYPPTIESYPITGVFINHSGLKVAQELVKPHVIPGFERDDPRKRALVDFTRRTADLCPLVLVAQLASADLPQLPAPSINKNASTAVGVTDLTCSTNSSGMAIIVVMVQRHH